MQSAWTTVTSIYGVVVVITMLVVFFGIQERVAVSAGQQSATAYHWLTIKAATRPRYPGVPRSTEARSDYPRSR